MSLIRPELAARLAPWREVMAAGVLAALGAWVFLLGGWIYRPVGVALIALAATGTVGWWGWLGVIPLLTGVFRTCPAYSVLGVNTCPLKKS